MDLAEHGRASVAKSSPVVAAIPTCLISQTRHFRGVKYKRTVITIEPDKHMKKKIKKRQRSPRIELGEYIKTLIN